MALLTKSWRKNKLFLKIIIHMMMNKSEEPKLFAFVMPFSHTIYMKPCRFHINHIHLTSILQNARNNYFTCITYSYYYIHLSHRLQLYNMKERSYTCVAFIHSRHCLTTVFSIIAYSNITIQKYNDKKRTTKK